MTTELPLERLWRDRYQLGLIAQILQERPHRADESSRIRLAVSIRVPLNERRHIGSVKLRGLQRTGTKPFAYKNCR
jgi:hypothetical protein